MEYFGIVFALPIIAVGIMLIAYVRSGSKRKIQQERGCSFIHTPDVKVQRQIELRRSRVWWKMDELHAELVEKISVGERAGLLLPPFRAASQANERAASVKTGEGCTLKDVYEAYEMFLRKG